MNILKLTLASATVSLGLVASASAMPVAAVDHGATNQVEQVRLVCNRWGHCWRTGGWGGGWRGGFHGGRGGHVARGGRGGGNRGGGGHGGHRH